MTTQLIILNWSGIEAAFILVELSDIVNDSLMQITEQTTIPKSNFILTTENGSIIDYYQSWIDNNVNPSMLIIMTITSNELDSFTKELVNELPTVGMEIIIKINDITQNIYKENFRTKITDMHYNNNVIYVVTNIIIHEDYHIVYRTSITIQLKNQNTTDIFNIHYRNPVGIYDGFYNISISQKKNPRLKIYTKL